MTSQPVRDDLVVLVADKNMEFAVKGLLMRPRALGIRALNAKILVHPHHDSGCRTRSQELLRPFINRCAYGIVMFDREGCGEDEKTREELESNVERTLTRNGWTDRAVAIVISPELETWVWSDSPVIDEVCGWKETSMSVRKWLDGMGRWADGTPKPDRPKESFEAVLHQTGEPRSSALYHQLARQVDFTRCTDPAFLKLRECLQKWFPPT